MAILTLQTLNDGTPHYSFRTQLEGIEYQFDFRYGERRGGWVFDLTTLSGQEIIKGQLVTCGRDLLSRVTAEGRPPGVLWAYNSARPSAANGGTFALPGLYDLGISGRCRLHYTESTTAAENEAAGIENPFAEYM